MTTALEKQQLGAITVPYGDRHGKYPRYDRYEILRERLAVQATAAQAPVRVHPDVQERSRPYGL